MTAPRSVRNTRKHRRDLTLERMESRQLLTVFAVTNNGDSGAGTLRNAIDNVNSTPGSNVILFQLPVGELVITPLTPLPQITQSTGTVFDAESSEGYNGKPTVTLSGAKVNTLVGVPGLDLAGGNITVEGMVIDNWGDAGGVGIKLDGLAGDVIQGCYIGTDSSGNSGAANGDGIEITNSNDTIGGTTPQTRNVISGNLFDQVYISGYGTSGHIIEGNYIGVGANGTTGLGALTGIDAFASSDDQYGGAVAGAGNVVSANNTGINIYGDRGTTSVEGNYIGTDATGTKALPNAFDGVDINGAANNTIGGLGLAGNVISGNGGVGISIQGATAFANRVYNNDIGVAVDGVTPLGNRSQGIELNGVLSATIGGDPAIQGPGYGNVIANNADYGIDLISGSGVAILTNSIYNNAGGGINIPPNTNGDLNPPVLADASSAAGQTNVDGSLLANPDTNYTIQFFSSPKADPSGFGQGETYLGETTVTTDGTGSATITERLNAGVQVGQIVTATATEVNTQNSTSFAQDVVVTQAPLTKIQVSITPTSGTSLLGESTEYTVTVLNFGPSTATGVTVVNEFDTNSLIQTDPANPSNPLSTTSVPGITSVFDSINPQNVDTTIGNLAEGASVSYTLTVMPIDTGTISLTSVASNMEIDSNPNPSATVTLTVNPAVDLAVALYAAPSPVAVGSPVTYTLSITNNGPSTATNIIATENLPANATLDTNSFNNSQGALIISPDGLTITYKAGDLGVGATATLSLNLIPDGVGTVDVSASALSDEADLNPANNSADLVTNVDYSTDLGVSVAATPTTASIGLPLTYVVTVNNYGPSDSTGAFLTDVLPAGVTFVSATPSQGPAATVTTDPLTGIVTVTDAPGPILNGANATLTLVVTPTVSTSLINSATVTNTTADELDPNPANNTTNAPEVLVSPVDLNVSLTAAPEPVFIGDNLIYTLDVNNAGPADATNVAVSDQLPVGVTVDSIVANDGGFPSDVDGVINYTFAEIANGSDGIITITVSPTASASIIDTASIDGSDELNTGTTLTASVTSSVSPADLNVGITTTDTTPIVGNPLSYTITFGNNGPADATNFVLTVPLPAGLTINGLTSTVGTASIDPTTNILSLNLPTLASGTTGTITLNVTPTVAETATIVATVSSDNFDPNAADNSASVSQNIINLPGTFNFAQPTYSVLETGGSITLTVNRTNGTLGDVMMVYTTVDGTAKAGVNYAYQTGGIFFPDGVTSETITIPVVHDFAITPNLNFQVELTGSSSGGGVIGTVGTTTVTVVNVDFDTVSPQVTAIQPVYTGKNLTGFIVGFTKQLNAATADNIANYAVFISGRDATPKAPNTPIQIKSAVYNPADQTVTLTTVVPLSTGKFYGVAINGSTPTGVRDTAFPNGNLLSGNGTGTPSDYDTYIAVGTNLTYTDGGNNTVNIKMTGGGSMVLTRFANGTANELELVGINPHHTKLTGTVTHANARGRQVPSATAINTIVGLGSFGDVHSTLTTPGFYVVHQPVISPTIISKVVPAGPKAKPALVHKKK